MTSNQGSRLEVGLITWTTCDCQDLSKVRALGEVGFRETSSSLFELEGGVKTFNVMRLRAYFRRCPAVWLFSNVLKGNLHPCAARQQPGPGTWLGSFIEHAWRLLMVFLGKRSFIIKQTVMQSCIAKQKHGISKIIETIWCSRSKISTSFDIYFLLTLISSIKVQLTVPHDR